MVLQREKSKHNTFIHTVLLSECFCYCINLVAFEELLKSVMSMSRDDLHCQVARSAATTRLGLSLIFFVKSLTTSLT